VISSQLPSCINGRAANSLPTPIASAFEFLAALRAQPSHLALSPGPQHLRTLQRVCEDGGASGDLVADAQLTAIALEHACEIVSFDRDFARFPGVVWHLPGRDDPKLAQS